MRRGIHTLLGAGLLGAGLLTAPTSAGAAPAEPCQLGTSNTDIRSCETTGAQAMPVPTLGDGICAGLVRAERITAFDGPLWEYSEAPGMTHGIEVNLAQGYAPLGEWGSTVLACDQTVHVDWRNLDTGQSGRVDRFIPAGAPSYAQQLVHIDSGPGNVELTVGTDQPHLPTTTHVQVP